MNGSRRTSLINRYALFGAAFGACFPAFSLGLDWALGRGHNVIDIFHSNPVQVVVALAPFVLGIVFSVFGRKQSLALWQIERAIRAEHIATRDSLTGQRNRLSLSRKVDAFLAASKNIKFGCLFLIDLDRFKQINDTFGHETGDALLIAVCNRLSAQLTVHQTLFRLGGDEFAILDTRSECGPSETANSLINAFNEPLDLGSINLSVGASVGFAAFRADDQNASSILRRADHALYAAKNIVGPAYHAFHPEMEHQAQVQASMETDMRADLEGDAFTLVYQPIINRKSGEVTAMEALARWSHPVRGDVRPDTFIPIAELMGLIVPLGRKLLAGACRDVVAWDKPVNVAVNVSAVQLCHPEFTNHVIEALRESNLPAERLVLEITERAGPGFSDGRLSGFSA